MYCSIIQYIAAHCVSEIHANRETGWLFYYFRGNNRHALQILSKYRFKRG